MRELAGLLVLALAYSLPLQATHLSEADVIALEQKCQKLREQKLAPEKEGYLLECLEEGDDPSSCELRSDDYGELKPGAIRRLGKYRARKHFRVNPPLR
jgi:hypothetical protein